LARCLASEKTGSSIQLGSLLGKEDHLAFLPKVSASYQQFFWLKSNHTFNQEEKGKDGKGT